ncbi:Protoporphyrinogen oxidase [Plenodomus tracheiphilus IPT5]|uniref:Protoporphyrinogen oxidase n=1 Tax=Plenodomus tracheiphilus IPT5 TaxID=1408161 RepID=A0A6A7B4U6_9PLEO|nr:Protoporphyrinogen oxidase [Plenodomus tracheiphilus IPT5]
MLFRGSHAPSTLTRRVVAGRHFSTCAHTPLCTRQLPLQLRHQPCPSRTSAPCLPLLQQRNYASVEKSSPESIAILGGGIAGLSSAYFISKEFPNAKITIFESGKETGGWIKSRRIDVGNGQDVLFELGPRTLRNSTVTASLIQELGLIDEVTYTNKDQPGAKNRYIYYPDTLNRLPSEVPGLQDVLALWRTGILSGMSSIIREPFRDPRPSGMTDETIGSFISRRFDKRVADNIVSAGLHGIYAGDVHQLSARTLFGLLWAMEGRFGSTIGGVFKMYSNSEVTEEVGLIHPTDHEMMRAMNEEIDLDKDFANKLKGAAMFTFTDGLQMLVRRLQDAITRKGNVEVKTETPIQAFEAVKGGMGVEVTSGPEDKTTTQTFDLAVSTLRHPSLTPYVTVQTVNLYFATPPSTLLPVQGFGYLIPQSIPFEQNPERALGVIFDSYGVSGQDTAPGTKLTVMMGGHWWDSWASYPDAEEGVANARAILQRHLGITEEPVQTIANTSHDCIPQYTLGYADRLSELATILSAEYKGRLRVVGNQFNGVGVNDCITGAWSVARGLRGSGWKGRSCGLERALDGRDWRLVPTREMVYRGKKGLGQGVEEEGMGRRGDGGV